MRGRTKAIAWAAGLLAIGAGAAGFVYLGVYDVSATDQHTRPVYDVLELAMRRAVGARAEPSPPSDFSSPAMLARGLRLYRAHCAQCHGAPGVAPESFALGMTPVPANLVETARHWSPAEIHWTVRHGLKMTGMPAWEFRLSRQELWDVTAFVHHLPALSPARYREMAAAAGATAAPASSGEGKSGAAPRGDGRLPTAAAVSTKDGKPGRGRIALSQYACTTCHVIPGITGATRHVGPPLAGLARRKYLAGLLSNTPENLVYWIRHPQRVDPRSAMPDLGVSETDARDMAAYLLSLEGGR